MSKPTPYHKALNNIRPFVFQVFTPSGSGTGFQILYSKRTKFIGIATAYHVISHENEWDEPIKVQHFESEKTLLLKPKHRVIFPYPEMDLAFILFYKQDMPAASRSLELIGKGKILKQGVETGWCGFPAIAPGELCFFAGHISCCLESQNSYLVDGVAINGVSGGPAFYIDNDSGDPKVCGVISAYRANRATGETLPGVSVVRTVNQYHETLKTIESIHEAEKEKELQEEKGEIPDTAPPKADNIPKKKPSTKRKTTTKKVSRKKTVKKKVALKKKPSTKRKTRSKNEAKK